MSSERVPQLRRHKTHKRAYVSYDGGNKQKYFGVAGDWPDGKKKAPAQVRAEYDAWLGRWLAGGRKVPKDDDEGLTVNQLVLAYDTYAEGYYKPGSTATTGELRCVREALRPLVKLYGATKGAEFGPKAFKVVRQHMVDLGWCRSYTNHQCRRIIRMFRWAASEELVTAEIYHALKSVPGLRKGMAAVRESPGIRPVPVEFVNASLPYMPPPVSAMVRLQLLSGCRACEITVMRTCDLDVSGDVWLYRPGSDKGPHGEHKNSHHGKERVIALGPQAQEVLRSWLRTELEAYLFCPAEAEEVRAKERRAKRKTPMTPSQRKRTRAKRRARPVGERYTSQSYSRAIARACGKANRESGKPVPVWTPSQLRHTTATDLRRKFGLEACKVILGHSNVETSQLYAERDLNAAIEVAKQVG